jgi:hypothetical protein
VPVNLTRARADYSDPRIPWRGVSGAIDADPISCWSNSPLVDLPHQAVFQAARPVGPTPGMRLRVELVSGIETAANNYTVRRFRLSVTDQPSPLFQPSLQTVRADTQRYGLTRLGAAYAQLGEWAAAAAILARAAARPDAPALDRFLLALAHHHLNRHDEAKNDCDRALERLGSDVADEATRDIALEALVTIRGLSLVAADALLLDLVFPERPFCS